MNILKSIVLTAALLVFNTCYALVVHLPQEITEQSIAPLIKEMKADKDKSEIYVYTDSSGGELISMHRFLLEMNKYKKTHTIVEHFAASAAAIITIYGDEVVIKRGAIVLFHRANCGDEEDTSDYKDCKITLDSFNEKFKEQYTAWGFNENSIEVMFEKKSDIILRFNSGLLTTGQGLVERTNRIIDSVIDQIRVLPRSPAYRIDN